MAGDGKGGTGMAERTMRIFISSPGDVGEERVIAGRVIERLEGEFGQWFDLDPVLWEHEPLRATGHFQEQIVLPSKTDVVVCILWSRLGTRLPEGFTREDGTPYASGTEWEFEDAARSFRERGTPDLLVYRKTREAVAGLSDKQALLKRLAQKEALDAFIERWFGSAEDSFKAAFPRLRDGRRVRGPVGDPPAQADRRTAARAFDRCRTGRPRVSWHEGSPFRGLEAFDFEHAPVFFGRTRSVGEVKRAIEAQAANGAAFLIVFGMSGSGKSSLIRAGLLPTISQPGVVEGVAHWRWCVLRPSDATGDLFDGLAQALLVDTALPELAAAKWDRARLAEQFQSAPISPLSRSSWRWRGPLKAVSSPPAPRPGWRWSSTRWRSCSRSSVSTRRSARDSSTCSRRWPGAAGSGSSARCAATSTTAAPRCPSWWHSARGRVSTTLSRRRRQRSRRSSATRRGQRGCVSRWRRRQASASTTCFMRQPPTIPAALPLLEFTLEELFKLRSEDGVLTFDAYQRLGGLDGALARRAEEVFAGLEKTAQDTLPAVLRALASRWGRRRKSRSRHAACRWRLLHLH